MVSLFWITFDESFCDFPIFAFDVWVFYYDVDVRFLLLVYVSRINYFTILTLLRRCLLIWTNKPKKMLRKSVEEKRSSLIKLCLFWISDLDLSINNVSFDQWHNWFYWLVGYMKWYFLDYDGYCFFSFHAGVNWKVSCGPTEIIFRWLKNWSHSFHYVIIQQYILAFLVSIKIELVDWYIILSFRSNCNCWRLT